MDETISEDVEVQETGTELSAQAGTSETSINVEIDLSPVLGRLEHLERLQTDFFNDVIDVSLFAIACLIGLFAFKEFMDRSTRW